MKQPAYKIFLFFIILFIGLYFKVEAQFYHLSQYSLEEGLPQSEVQAIMEDHLGYIWIGTNGGGLCRFNGRSFDIYTRKNGLNENIIFGLYQDNNFDLWVGSPGAILRYDGKIFNKVLISDSTLFRNGMKFFETSGGNIWLHTNLSDGKKGFFRIRNDSVVNAYDLFDELTEDNPVIYITMLNSNHLIITTQKGYYNLISDELTTSDILPVSDEKLYVPLLSDRNKNIWTISFDRLNRNRKLQIYRSSELIKDIVLPEGYSANSITNSYQDRAGGVWLSFFNSGVLRFSKGEWKVFNEKNGLPISSVRNVHEDAEGNFWFGTLGAGLVRYSNDLFITFDTRSGLSNSIVRSIFQDSKGIYYFGGNNGCLNIYDGNEVRVENRKGEGRKGYISSMHEVKPGLLLLGTLSGLYEFDGKYFSACNKKYGLDHPLPVLDIETIGDTLFFATYGEGVVKSINGSVTAYNKTNSLYNVFATTDLFVDSNSNVWVCSDKGIWLYSDSGMVSVNKKYNLDISYILQAAEDKYGNIWFASFTNGLLRFDGDRFTVIDASYGLASDNIYSVICDDDGNIWAGTQNGVDKLTLSNSGDIISIDNFGKYDGFVGIENNGNANFKDNEGNLWFGTIKGAIKYNPSNRRTNYLPPPVYISNIEIGFKQVNWNEQPYREMYDSISRWLNMPVNLKLPHNKNHISFSFDGLCFTVPEKVRYMWKLDPVETDYLPETKNNRAVYSSLSPGNYTFYVKACNNSGIWNEEPAVFSFTVKPAWWQTTALKLLIFVFLMAVAGIIIRAWRDRNLLFRRDMKSLLDSKSSEIQKQKDIIHKKKEQLNRLDGKIADLNNHVKKYQDNLKNLAQFGNSVLSGVTVEQAFMNSYRDMSEVMDVSLFGLGILNKKTSELDFQNVIIDKERVPFIKFPLDDTERLSIHCLLNDQEIFTKDIKNEYHNYVKELRPVSGDMNPRSVIFVPLKISGNVIGILTVQSPVKDAYNEYHLNLIKIIADYMAFVVDGDKGVRSKE